VGLFVYNSGVVKNLGMVAGSVSGSNAGGIAGYNSGTITNCYNTGIVSGSSYAGDIAGYNEGTIKDILALSAGLVSITL